MAEQRVLVRAGLRGDLEMAVEVERQLRAKHGLDVHNSCGADLISGSWVVVTVMPLIDEVSYLRQTYTFSSIIVLLVSACDWRFDRLRDSYCNAGANAVYVINQDHQLDEAIKEIATTIEGAD